MDFQPKRAVLAAATALMVAAVPLAAHAATVVRVSLWDKGADTEMPTGLAFPAADLSKATMGIKTSTATARTGIVSFKVTNDSKDTIHEMIVMQLADPAAPLPYIAAEQRVDEDKAGDKGEVSELDPGKSGSLTLDLKPGNYLLICNVPGHFAAGMWTRFTVTK